MSRIVCFIDDNGQTATCINFDDDGDCAICPYNDDAHKKWVAELEKNLKEKPRLQGQATKE